jgi:hypothetical protein
LATETGISVTVPAGALSASADFLINDIGAPRQPFTDTRAALRAFTLRALDAGGEPIPAFAQPLTVAVTYADGELRERGIREDTLDMASWDGGGWVSLLPCAGCSVDAAASRVTVVVDQAGEFALTGWAQLFLPSVQRP